MFISIYFYLSICIYDVHRVFLQVLIQEVVVIPGLPERAVRTVVNILIQYSYRVTLIDLIVENHDDDDSDDDDDDDKDDDKDDDDGNDESDDD